MTSSPEFASGTHVDPTVVLLEGGDHTVQIGEALDKTTGEPVLVEANRRGRGGWGAVPRTGRGTREVGPRHLQRPRRAQLASPVPRRWPRRGRPPRSVIVRGED